MALPPPCSRSWQVALLETMDEYERSQIADALKTEAGRASGRQGRGARYRRAAEVRVRVGARRNMHDECECMKAMPSIDRRLLQSSTKLESKLMELSG